MLGRSEMRCSRFPRDAHALCRTTKEEQYVRLLLTGTRLWRSDDRVVDTESRAAIPLSGLADIPLALERVDPIEKVTLCFYLDGWKRSRSL